MTNEIDRRRFLALTALTVVAACTADSDDAESNTNSNAESATADVKDDTASAGEADVASRPTLPGTADATTAPLISTTTVAPTTAPTTTASTIAPTTTSAIAPTLTAPKNPRAPEPDVVIGRLTIAALGVTHDLREGVTLTTIDKGPGRWPGSAWPGERGNVVVAGHRVTHTKPFRHLDKLKTGEPVIFAMSDGATHEYRVTGTEIVDDKAMWITRPTETPTATLFACHPPGSARQRIVVHLSLDA
jgi:sortase A